MKEKEAQRIANEKSKIEVLISKHIPNKPQTPDEVDQTGIGSNPNKKAMKPAQIMSSKDMAVKPKRAKKDPLLGDPIDKPKKNIKKNKPKSPTDNITEDNIRVYEFVFQGLPSPPDLEGVDEERLMALQRKVQEQLRKGDKERERNITKKGTGIQKDF